MLLGMMACRPSKDNGASAAGQIYSAQARQDGLLLVSASEVGDVEAVKMLLQMGAYVHAQDSGGRCALVAAAYKNNIEIAGLLIAAGADVNLKDNTIQSAFLISAMQGYLDFMKKTLEAGADVNSTDSDNGTALIRASDRGHAEIIKELLKTSIRVNHVNGMGWTALHEAVLLGDGGERHTEVVRLLAAAGADVNLPDKNGDSPLVHAQNKNYGEMAKIMMEAGL
jgi:ankyrin repeat protein